MKHRVLGIGFTLGLVLQGSSFAQAQSFAPGQPFAPAQSFAQAQPYNQVQAPSSPATGSLRPVPKLNAAAPRTGSDTSSVHNARYPGWNLPWRETQLPNQGPTIAASGYAQPENSETHQSARNGIQQVSGVTSNHRQPAVRTAHLLEQTLSGNQSNGVARPVPDAMTDTGAKPGALAPNNFFENPFGDDDAQVRRTRRAPSRTTGPRPKRFNTIQTSAQDNQLDLLYAAPQQTTESPDGIGSNRGDQPVNNLRSPNELPQPSAQGDAFPSGNQPPAEFGLPDSVPTENLDSGISRPDLRSPSATGEASNPPSSGNIRDLMEQSEDPRRSMDNGLTDDNPSDIQTLPAPQPDEPSLLDQNPFNNDQDDELEQLRRDLNLEPSTEQPRSFNDRGAPMDDDQQQMPEGGISCEEFRSRVRAQSIREVSLDPSPPFRPDVIDQEEYEELKREFDERQAMRQWRSIDGTPLAVGSLRDLAYQKAVIETQQGGLEELPLDRLSEADVSYITENWGLPQECLIEQVVHQPRQWSPMTMTWKASNLCHKPLYFEEVNLERYGHTAGPLLQPVVSSAHFFANISVLPYKMGVHSPHECQYALGYYRPGSCAPWIIPPKPISARGAVYQAAAMSGLFWLIP